MNLPGSYEAFLELFAPEEYFRLVVRPADRCRRVQLAIVAGLAAVLAVACGCALLISSPASARHVSAARGHHHHRQTSHVVPRDRNESLGQVV